MRLLHQSLHVFGCAEIRVDLEPVLLQALKRAGHEGQCRKNGSATQVTCAHHNGLSTSVAWNATQLVCRNVGWGNTLGDIAETFKFVARLFRRTLADICGGFAMKCTLLGFHGFCVCLEMLNLQTEVFLGQRWTPCTQIEEWRITLKWVGY